MLKMLRMLFIKMYQKTKTNNFKAFIDGKMILRILKLKI